MAELGVFDGEHWVPELGTINDLLKTDNERELFKISLPSTTGTRF